MSWKGYGRSGGRGDQEGWVNRVMTDEKRPRRGMELHNANLVLGVLARKTMDERQICGLSDNSFRET